MARLFTKALCFGSICWCCFVPGLGFWEKPEKERRPILTTQEASDREKKAGKDVAKLLDLAEQVEAGKARHLLRQVVQIVGEKERHEFSPEERDKLAQGFARVLAAVARTPQQVEEVLRPASPKTVARQIFYHRYREQWIFESPFPLGVVFDRIKGSDSQTLTVRVLAGENP